MEDLKETFLKKLPKLGIPKDITLLNLNILMMLETIGFVLENAYERKCIKK